MYKLQINNLHLENTTNKLNKPVTIIGYRDIDNMNDLYDFFKQQHRRVCVGDPLKFG